MFGCRIQMLRLRGEQVTTAFQISSISLISLQKLFGKDDKFFTLLEASGDAACNSVRALSRILQSPGNGDLVTKFHAAKEEDKKITEKIG